MLKNKRGITLIALVITAVILLILASILISLAVGHNGIITQSNDAIKENRKEKEKEEVEMAWANLISEYYAKSAKNSSIKKDEIFTESNMQKYLNWNGRIVPGSFHYNSEGISTIDYISDENKDVIYKFEINSNGQVEEIEISSWTLAIDADYSGDVSLGDELKSSSGESFYVIMVDNSTNIYLIASNHLPKEKVPTNNTGMTLNEDSSSLYGVYWDTAPEAQIVNTTTCPSRFLWDKETAYTTSWTDYSTNPNGNCISTLLNTNNWSEFVNPTYADYAIGTPTLQMYVESWNAKGYNKLYADNKNEFRLLCWLLTRSFIYKCSYFIRNGKRIRRSTWRIIQK